MYFEIVGFYNTPQHDILNLSYMSFLTHSLPLFNNDSRHGRATRTQRLRSNIKNVVFQISQPQRVESNAMIQL